MAKYAVVLFALFVIVHGNGGDLDSLLENIDKPASYIPINQGAKPVEQRVPDQPVPNAGTSAGESSNTPCTTDTEEDGECVSYFLCDANNTINTDGYGIIDIRFGGPCENYMETCCKLTSKSEIPIVPKPPPIVKEIGCGFRNSDGVGFRIKGDKDNEAQFGEFPWMVAILREEKTNKTQKLNVYQCGGSLIHPKVVLTAAHCVVGTATSGVPKLKVRVGEWDTQTKNEIYPHQDRNVAKIIKHEKYYAGGLFNDIALLILDSPIEDAENVGVVCLPQQGPAAPPNKCVASGWGKDVFGKEGRYQVILKKVDLPIVERSKCQKTLRKTRLGNRFELHKSFICAGGESGKDTCKGDGGSPLVCPIPEHPGRYMQSGIVAWGIGCNDDSVPGVYVNIAFLRDWIDQQMVDNHIDMSAYSSI